MSRSSHSAAGSSIVLDEITINEEGPLYLGLKGHNSGLIAFIMNLLGLDTKTVLLVFKDRIHVEQSSLFSGRISETIPMKKISNVGTGYSKSLWLLILFVFFMFITGGCFLHTVGVLFSSLKTGNEGSLFALSVVLTAFFAVVSVILLFLYSQKKNVLYVLASSGHGFALCIEKGLIAGKKFSLKDMDRFVDIIMRLVQAFN